MDRFDWAEKHDGLLTTAVLRSSGRTKRMRERERMNGRTRVVRRGVVAVGGSPRSWRQSVQAAILAAGDDVGASNETALRMLGGERIESDIHLLAPLRRQIAMEGVVAHRSGTIEEGDIVEHGGIRCTSALRTVIDLSGTLDDRTLGKVIDDFLRRKLFALEELRTRVNRTRPAPGRSVARLRRMLAARIPGYDPGESVLEARIALIIDAACLPRPVQQFKITLGSHKYRMDFAWPDRRLYLEGNGFGCHSIASDLDSDARRQNEMVLDRWIPIEITWRMTNVEIESTLRRFLTLAA